MKAAPRRVEVWTEWLDMTAPAQIGVLTATPGRGKEIFSFEYDRAWLASSQAQVFDPALSLYRGSHFAPDDRPNFGAFLDSAPDRWGRLLMRRREALAARQEGRSPRTLRESDYLLGVYDRHRLGALRFRTEPNGPFLDDDARLASPPWTSLRELEHASLQLERDDAEEDEHYAQWLRMLVSPGGSLGGARPKAGVRDEHDALWIAKFPSRNDDEDVGAWEKVAHDLASRAGVVMAPAMARRFNSRHHTFLTKRFDRTSGGRRVHFASAMTLLGRTDGDDAASGVSYLDLATILARQGSKPTEDLEQLWRRIAFNVCVSNADDHLRNHGFLLEAGGWALAPAYDINPVVDSSGLTLNISEADNSLDLELVAEVASQFRVKPGRAREIFSEVKAAVGMWREVAASLKLSKAEQGRMAAAFRT